MNTSSAKTRVPVQTALISVSEREGLPELLKVLARRNIRIIATGGTAKYIEELGYWVTEVSDYTDFPEIMDGRVKTLHPRVHGGILAERDNPRHCSAMNNHEISGIDLVVINLYPFEKVIAKGCTEAEAIENIDIGGPAMLRAAAKNNKWVTVLSDPGQYSDFIDHFEENSGATEQSFRSKAATQAFTHTARYDSIISDYLCNRQCQKRELPDTLIQVLHRKNTLSYGENPHQKAAVYVPGVSDQISLCNSEPLHGRRLSYNNLLDASAALRTVSDFDDPTAVIIKHNTPCGVASHDSIIQAFHHALASDSLSAFGGVLALNRPLTPEMVAAWENLFLEVVIAPEIERTVLNQLSKRKNLRLLEVPLLEQQNWQSRSIPGGVLLQEPDTIMTPSEDMSVVSKRKPDLDCWQELLFAWKVVRHVKSNAVVFARNQATVAIGTGQTSRFYAVQSAIAHSTESLSSTVLASDAFFPFADGVEAAIDAGARAIIQPGGATRDAEIIELADARDIVLVHTGVRHFTH